MNEQEAIETILYASAFNREDSPLTQALDMTIEALEEKGAIERIVKSLEQFRKPVYKDEYGNNVANIESVFSIIKEEVERHEESSQ